jgi:hypothetical protein
VSSQPTPVSDRAADNLRFIRETMERAAAFTAVPGWGGVAMGISALLASFLAQRQDEPRDWLRIWMLELVVALVLGGIAMIWKAHSARTPLLGGPARRFAIAFAPPVLAGGALTWALAARGQYALLPGLWLLLYGSGVIAGGLNSVRVVPLMGALFFTLGVAALFTSGNLFLTLGFGVLHVIFGSIIAWRFGG